MSMTGTVLKLQLYQWEIKATVLIYTMHWILHMNILTLIYTWMAT
jgi:hypothetical protein